MGSMREEYRRALNKCRVALIRDLDVLDPEFSAHLIQEGVLTDHMHEDVRQCQTRQKSCEKLLEIISHRGDAAFKVLMKALVETGQEHLRNLVQDAFDKEEERDDDEYFYDSSYLLAAITKESIKDNVGTVHPNDTTDHLYEDELDNDGYILVSEDVSNMGISEVGKIRQEARKGTKPKSKYSKKSRYSSAHEPDELVEAFLKEDVIVLPLHDFSEVFLDEDFPQPSQNCTETFACKKFFLIPEGLEKKSGAETAVKQKPQVMPKPNAGSGKVAAALQRLDKDKNKEDKEPDYANVKERKVIKPQYTDDHKSALKSAAGEKATRAKLVAKKFRRQSTSNYPVIQVDGAEFCKVEENAVCLKEGTPLLIEHSGDYLRDQPPACIAYDLDGRSFCIPASKVSLYGGPEKEPWFYPIRITTKNATFMLQQRKREGCFMVYPSSKNDGYYLAVCDEFGQVWPYPIKEEDREFSLGGDYRVFPTLKDLVNYFRCSRYGLVTRLRRPFKEAHLAITPGHHYQKSFEIEDDLQEGTKLGNGQFGIVVNATLKTQDVAAKMLHTQDVSDSAEDDFLNEAQTLMRLCHDHIIKLVGVRFSQEPFAIVMEKMPCGNLRQWLKNNEVSDLPYFDVFENIASALKYLERQRYILHRDVAARNVLLSESFHAKLADFGMARYVEDDRYRACKNEKISVKWAAPEVLEEAIYSTKSDVWAFGIFLWEVLSNGQPPYPEKNNRETAIFVKQGKIMDFPPTKGKLNNKTPLDKADLFYDIMKQCWHTLPENRPTSTQLYELVAPAKNYYPVDGTLRQPKLMSKKLGNRPLPLVPQTDAASRGPLPPPPRSKHHLPPPFPGTKLVNDAFSYDSDSDKRKSKALGEDNLGEPANVYELPKDKEDQNKKWKFWKNKKK